MQITSLGHAGFCVETEKSMIIMDPWLSKEGAFDSAWFQYPKNHHMAEVVQQKLLDSSKDNYLYISHEHQDHFDLQFLNALKSRHFTLLLAHYAYPVVKRQLDRIQYESKRMVVLDDDEPFLLADGEIRLFIIDTELNCDSAILLKSDGQSFLNINDCKIHDRLERIVLDHGPIDVLTGQFSGASWYPTCYQMSEEAYLKVCDKKVGYKFKMIARAIEKTKPKLYLPSAGPPCFLDPLLMPFHDQVTNTYPRAPALLAYLDEHCQMMKAETQWVEMMPGDVLETKTLSFLHREAPLQDDHFMAYVASYAKEVQPLFQAREKAQKEVHPEEVFHRLKTNLEHKLSQLDFVHQSEKTLLYWRLSDYPQKMYCVDLAQKTIKTVSELQDNAHYYRITAPAWLVDKVLTHQMTWPDFALTFRVSIERVPNRYDTLLHGFLILDAEKIHSFCDKMAKMKKERVLVEHAGKSYSILRYCPHQGADLSQGHFEGNSLVCPRHQWHFDLDSAGKCQHNDTTIDAMCLSDFHANLKKEEGIS
ncbi:MAG: Rieske 2Fe-2S domain-containing protein [Legionellales bacterium]|nr:Rieske 2Fe-2S domain-containing protein [Legionellales bacterium]